MPNSNLSGGIGIDNIVPTLRDYIIYGIGNGKVEGSARRWISLKFPVACTVSFPDPNNPSADRIQYLPRGRRVWGFDGR